MMFHGEYPPVHETELVFWRYKSGVVLDDNAVYNEYRYGKGTLKALEVPPLNKIVEQLEKKFPRFSVPIIYQRRGRRGGMKLSESLDQIRSRIEVLGIVGK